MVNMAFNIKKAIIYCLLWTEKYITILINSILKIFITTGLSIDET